ncbi:hypothetical protein Tdes44962_MAKER10137, partial [Teratosphaeria destructans]
FKKKFATFFKIKDLG